jgi:hypothetical protein
VWWDRLNPASKPGEDPQRLGADTTAAIGLSNVLRPSLPSHFRDRKQKNAARVLAAQDD